MRTKRDEAVQMAEEMAANNDVLLAELRTMAGEALRDPFNKDSAMRLLLAAVTLPMIGIGAIMTDFLPGIVRRSRDPGLDEPASDA